MSWIHRLRPKSDLNKIRQKYFGADELWKKYANNPSVLAQIVNALRPWIWKRNQKPTLLPLIDLLKNDDHFRKGLTQYLAQLFFEKRLVQLLTDADIIQDVSFFYELKKRIIAKVLPHQPDVDSVEYILTQVFYVKSDQKWVTAIHNDELLQLFELVNLSGMFKNKNLFLNRQIEFASQILVTRISGIALESEVIKMVPEFENYNNPFIALQHELADFLNLLKASHFEQYNESDLKQLNILHTQCLEYVERAYKNSRKFGISMRVNQYLLRIKQQLIRLKSLINLLLITDEKEKRIQTSRFAMSIYQSRYNIYDLFDLSTKRVAFEITQHKAKSGEHYITKTSKDYHKMLRASLGGGAIVGILCIIKLLLSKFDLSPFGSAVFYSLNYALGFILIYLLGFTLATKQPAMTASSFISTLEKGRTNSKKRMKYKAFAVLFAQLWRSQFISFVGNVVMAFPIALLGIWAIEFAFSTNIAEAKSSKLLSDIHPFKSKALFHSAIAGVYLFLSGVISGSLSNSLNHNKIPFRIKEHPLLKVVLGKEKTAGIADFVSNKYAGIASNFWFGIFMGSTASIGYFLGLDLDIRHITFASGNMALGLYGMDWQASIELVLMVTLGIGLIGFINFGISFTLSVIVAMRSVDLPLLELRFLFSSVLEYFLVHPFRFMFPINTEDEEKILSNET